MEFGPMKCCREGYDSNGSLWQLCCRSLSAAHRSLWPTCVRCSFICTKLRNSATCRALWPASTRENLPGGGIYRPLTAHPLTSFLRLRFYERTNEHREAICLFTDGIFILCEVCTQENPVCNSLCRGNNPERTTRVLTLARRWNGRYQPA